MEQNSRTTISINKKASTFSTSNFSCQQKIILDYIISHAENDQRPYLRVSIFGREMLGLLDSGATRTIVGRKGWKILQDLKVHLNTEDSPNCTVANGNLCNSLGSVTVPIQLTDKVRLIDVLVIPDLNHTLILGYDFWTRMGIIPDLRRDVWKFCSSEELMELQTVESRLSPEQNSTFGEFIKKKFERMGQSIGCTHLIEHEIVVDSPPIKQRYYPVSPVVQKQINEELQKLLDEDIVEPSTSGWSSPIILVPKKEGGYRFCVDFRKLNKVTKKDAYPLPYVSAILDRLKTTRYLSSLDIKSAYYQIKLKPSSREYTAFTVPGRGLFQFKRLCFGLTNAPACWQRLIDRVLGSDLEENIFVYLDDIIIISDTYEKHLEILDKVFSRLTEAGLTVNREKCKFFRSELKYLGYVIDSEQGLRVDPDKVKAILDIPTPKTVKEVRSFLGMASWYRRFVDNFSALISPLTNLLRKNQRFIWTTTCEEAFGKIKECLVSAPILSSPDFTKGFYVKCDASGYGLGAVLTQIIEDKERVICYLSRSLTKQEKKYTTTERELLAVLFAVEKLRPYLEGSEFTVETDHHSLVWLDNLKNPNGRLCRWAVKLQSYNFKVVHRKGKDHVIPDALSRAVPNIDTIVDEHTLFDRPVNTYGLDFSNVKDKWYIKLQKTIIENPLQYAKWRVEQGCIFKYVNCKTPEFSEKRDYWKLVLPKEHRLLVLKQCHDDPKSGHPGVFKTFGKVSQHYYWPKMKADVARYVNGCKTCISYKSVQKPPAGLMGTRPKISKPFELISCDILGPLPRSTRGYTHVLVVCCYFSKFVLTFPLRSATAKQVCRHIEEDVFLLFGVPLYLITDNGVQFRSKDFTTLCRNYNTKILFNAVYHAQNNPTERVNRVVKTMLSCYIKDNQRKWDIYLASVTCAIRTLVHEVLQYTPFYVLFGREYIGNGKFHSQYNLHKHSDVEVDRSEDRIVRDSGFKKIFDSVKARLQKAYERSSARYNLRRRPIAYSPGDLVWRRNHVISSKADYFNAKFAPKYVGPCKIRKKLGTCSYELEDENGKIVGVYHVNDLKPSRKESEEAD